MKMKSFQTALLITSLLRITQADASLIPWPLAWVGRRVLATAGTIVNAGLGRSNHSIPSLEEAMRGSLFSNMNDNPIVLQEHKKTSTPVPPEENNQSNKQTVNVADIITSALEQKKEGDVSITINLNNEHTQYASGSLPSEKNDYPPDSKERPKQSPILVPISSSDWFTSVSQWISTHKFKSTCYFLTLTYATIQATLLSLRWSLMQDTAWSWWKKQCTLEDLYRIKQTDLIKDLMHTLQDPENENRISATALNRCIKEIDKEIESLKRYRSLVGLIDRRFFRKIFYYNVRLLEESADRIQRLLFIRSTACTALNDLKQHHSYDALFSQPRQMPILPNILPRNGSQSLLADHKYR